MIHSGWPKWNPVAAEDFGYFEMVLPHTDQFESIHPQSDHIPHAITDRAIAVGREQSLDRMVVHYMLPHFPLIADAIDWSPGKTSINDLMNGPKATRDLTAEEFSYGLGEYGDVSVEIVQERYRQNIRLVLDYVEVLLQNINADRVVISSDHGEELNQNSIRGHPYGYPFSPVKTVPWVETTASDQRTYATKFDREPTSPSQKERNELLRNLGYI